MRIVLNCMARDEAHHAPSSMAHFTSLFDEIYVIEHRSQDETAPEILDWSQASCPVHLMHLKSEGYFQSEVMTWLARQQIAQDTAEWIFFLDFDEYLPFKTRSEFEQALLCHRNDAVINMSWLNLIPSKYDGSKHLGKKFRVGPDASQYGKIAFQPALLKNTPDFVVEQGNHAVTKTHGGDRLPSKTSFGLFHIPIDSSDQLKRKLATGIQSYKEHHSEGRSLLGRHWILMQDLLERGGDERTIMNCIAARYGENDFLNSLSEQKIANQQSEIDGERYRDFVLDVAGVGVSKPKDPRAEDPFIVLTVSADGQVEGPKFVSKDKRHISFHPKDTAILGTLDNVNPLAKDGSAPTQLDNFFSQSYGEIETLTPTAWGEHIPFMFSLISTLRPRRYVELGTHCGASFFAVCQRMAELKLPSLAVAVDLWEGDYQAGYYDEQVYNDFEYLRTSRYPSQSRSIRSLFSDAAPLFEDGSVDLIHIDGLHTYEAVKEDYETWRPKLTEHGVILFHDTNEYQSTFGVWHFFDQIRDSATASFEFKHAHGLGILAFGDPEHNPMIGMLQKMNSERVKTEAHFSRLGELAVKEALYGFVSAAPQPQQDPVPVITTNDFAGVSTKTIAQVLMQRVKNKSSLLLRTSRISPLARGKLNGR